VETAEISLQFHPSLFLQVMEPQWSLVMLYLLSFAVHLVKVVPGHDSVRIAAGFTLHETTSSSSSRTCSSVNKSCARAHLWRVDDSLSFGPDPPNLLTDLCSMCVPYSCAWLTRFSGCGSPQAHCQLFFASTLVVP
jgi:hypothetical protein